MLVPSNRPARGSDIRGPRPPYACASSWAGTRCAGTRSRPDSTPGAGDTRRSTGAPRTSSRPCPDAATRRCRGKRPAATRPRHGRHHRSRADRRRWRRGAHARRPPRQLQTGAGRGNRDRAAARNRRNEEPPVRQLRAWHVETSGSAGCREHGEPSRTTARTDCGCRAAQARAPPMLRGWRLCFSSIGNERPRASRPAASACTSASSPASAPGN